MSSMQLTAQPGVESHLGRFKLSAFRPGQREVIAAVLDGKDCLCIMPTGGGKSLCYQLPAIARPGLTLVVSPLIALMKDQVDSLTRNGIPATCINSNIDFDEQQARLEAVQAGRYSLLYVAPERFRNQRFVETIAALRPQLLAIDEAHCVSEWGHDFRPDYARIAGFRRRVGNPQTIALTATATPHVRQDVINLLELRQPATFITGFARENLRFEVNYTGGARAKLTRLIELLTREPGPGIVYASTRKKCGEVADALRQATRRKVGVYHAGIDGDERRQVQDQFMSDRLDLIVATNAFGMGIDKSDLRIVVHFNMPGSLEAYYQEAGRAGRDGKPSRCVLLFASSDRHVQEFFIENSHPSAQTIEDVYDFLRGIDADPIELTQEQIKEQARLDTGAEAVGASEQVLARAGVLERLESRQNMAAVKLNSDLPTLVDLLPQGAKVQRKVLRALEQLVGERRRERIYFHPRQLSERTEMEPPALARALRELSDLDAVDYVPPFRGRAVHMLVRDKSFDELEIDLTALEEKRTAEYSKLDRMERYCRTDRCRQWEVLDYFGDPAAGPCGTCDNCRQHGSVKGQRQQRRDEAHEAWEGETYREGEAPAEPAPRATPKPVKSPPREANRDWRADLKGPSSEERPPPSSSREPNRGSAGASPSPAAARPAGPTSFSGPMPQAGSLGETVLIALSGVARAKGRCGKGLVVQMLGGSKSAKMAKLRLDQLTTFGRLGHFKQEVINDLLNELLRMRLLEQEETDRFRPVLQLAPLGWEVIRGQRELDWATALSPSLRAQLGDPAAKRDTLRPAAPKPAPRPASDPFAATPISERPAFYWTWRLVSSGWSPAECQAALNLGADTFAEHLRAAAAAGLNTR